MSGKQYSLQSAPPCVEALESRRLLSAAPVSYMPGTPAQHAAAIVHSTIPILTGAPFVGTATASDGTIYLLTITVTSERKSGALAGSLTVSTNGQTLTYTCTGSVNRRGVLVIYGRSGGHKTVTVGYRQCQRQSALREVRRQLAAQLLARHLHGQPDVTVRVG